MITLLVVVIALGLDACLGEARRFHPLVGFGHLAQWLERRIYADSIFCGVLAVFLLLAPFIWLTWISRELSWIVLVDVILLYLAIGWNSLGVHARSVSKALLNNDLIEARRRVGYMVSRDTSELEEQEVAKATVESVLENGNDAIFGAIFWYVIAGAPGVVVYRLVNTLDAMWGYRNSRYQRFGRAAARFDDVLNFVPSRLTALGYVVGYAAAGSAQRAWLCWRSQASAWKSPNAGPVMAAGAGSLGVMLGGSARYHGELEFRPPLGEGRLPEAGDIERALQLIRRTLGVWVLFLFAGGSLSYVLFH